MADLKISQLTSYVTPVSSDVLPIVDTTLTTTKKITIVNFMSYIASLTQTLTNKRVTKRKLDVTQSATPTINTDNADIFYINSLAQAITSMTTNLSGTPVYGDMMEIGITDNGTARAITWGASFASTTVALPTTTVVSVPLRVLFQRNYSNTAWDCIAVA